MSGLTHGHRRCCQSKYIGSKIASQAGIGIVIVRQVEGGATEPRRVTLVVVRQAVERAGIEFIYENGGSSGVRLRKRRWATSSK